MNAGLRALKKESPEAYENITGEKAMYGMKTPMAEYGKKNMMGMGGTNMYAEAGTKMPKDLIDYFEKKKAEYGAKIMAMSGMKVMGDGGKYYEHGGAHSEGGPFAAAQAQIEQNLSPLRGDLLSKIESDPKKMAWANENISGVLKTQASISSPKLLTPITLTHRPTGSADWPDNLVFPWQQRLPISILE